LVGTPEGNNHLEKLGVGRKIILKWILNKQDGRLLAEFVSLRIGTGGGLLKIRY
jgi:hypothetical protein